MENFTQKWAIVTLFESVDEGAIFPFTDFPLHLTFAGVFAIEKDEDWLVQGLTELLTRKEPFEITAGEVAMFGENNDIKVRKIIESPELMSLHKTIHEWLIENGVVYNSPQYQGRGFAPHSTFQKSGGLDAGEKRIITSLSLIDLFPDGDALLRKVTKTIEL